MLVLHCGCQYQQHHAQHFMKDRIWATKWITRLVLRVLCNLLDLLYLTFLYIFSLLNYPSLLNLFNPMNLPRWRLYLALTWLVSILIFHRCEPELWQGGWHDTCREPKFRREQIRFQSLFPPKVRCLPDLFYASQDALELMLVTILTHLLTDC